ncbi:MAG: glycosyltransferase family 39 protein [Patescibacteria group bacterium]|nr:glycosyltransferase family 39 protein [Patescibacteria group bacterium]
MKKEYWTLGLIFILALVLRIVNLSSLPPSLNWDEVSHGYNAYSILKTGMDEWGQSFPLANFRAYGDYPLPLYMYLSMPGILLFGLNEFSIRLPSAILGSLLVVVIFFLTKRISKNSLAGIMAALLVALSPWSIFTSRQVLQATPAIFFMTLGVYLFLKGVEELKRLWLILGVVSLGLSAYAYHNTRILAPVFFLILILIYRQVFLKYKKLLLQILVVGALFFVPLVYIVLSPQGSARAAWVEIVDQGAINQIDELRGKSLLPAVASRLMYNKITYSGVILTKNYLGYFNPLYLGFDGGTQYQFSIPYFGIIYPIELPFFYLGLAVLLLSLPRLTKQQRVLIAWLFIGALPAAITRDPSQVVRSMTMMPPLYVVTIYGFVTAFTFLQKKGAFSGKCFIALFLIILAIFFGRYYYNYWNIYPKEYSSAWQYGYKQAITYIAENQDKYAEIFITKKYGEPHEFLLFYMKYDPNMYRTDPNLVRYEKSSWFWVDSFAKYRFVNDWEVKEKVKCPSPAKCLLVTSPGNYPVHARILQSIYFLDRKVAFDIVEL